MDKAQVVSLVLGQRPIQPIRTSATAYAPANIALIKYWGKRDCVLNTPLTSSLSVSLATKGATTTVQQATENQDQLILDGAPVPTQSEFYRRCSEFLTLFRPAANFYFHVDTSSTVPIAAGLASSASGYAALLMALQAFFGWQTSTRELSILARLGSGSACRSLWHGFVYWHVGERQDGLDSYAEPLSFTWPELRLGILLNDTGQKKVSSRQGMLHSQQTSPYYGLWPQVVARDLDTLQTALSQKCFSTLGKTAEANAQAMHALTATARPAFHYSNPQTWVAIAEVEACRAQGIEVYYTQDAGPHLKLLFLSKDTTQIRTHFPECEVISPFSATR